MRRRRLLLVVTTALLLAPDLAQKAFEPRYGHPRSLAYAALAAALLAGVVAFVPRVPSRVFAVAGGIAAAGAGGNLVAALVWRDGVPNPLVAGAVAFNLADVYAVAGAGALVAGAVGFAIRHPNLLHERV